MQAIWGAFAPETLTMKCVHGIVKEYQTKKVSLDIVGLQFWCRASVVPQLDCRMLIGQECPIIRQIL